MSKRTREPTPKEAADEIRLTQSEFVDLIKADADCELTRAQSQASQLATQLIEAQVKIALRDAKEHREQTDKLSRQAEDKRRALAKVLAERYAFSWATHSYCNETGVIRRAT